MKGIIIGGVFISFAFLIYLFVSIFIVGPALDQALDDVSKDLGNNLICPSEFSNSTYKICFDAEGEVVIDGTVASPLKISFDGIGNSCTITTGNYELEYSGCKLNNFKQMTAYDLVLVSNSGKLSLKGATMASYIAQKSGIVAISPKGIKWMKRLVYFVKFL